MMTEKILLMKDIRMFWNCKFTSENKEKKWKLKKLYKLYFTGHKENKEIRPVCIFFPEVSIYKRYSVCILW